MCTGMGWLFELIDASIVVALVSWGVHTPRHRQAAKIAATNVVEEQV